MRVSKCDFCRFRNSWDCEDYRPENGCEDFVLDMGSLTDDEKRMVILRSIPSNYGHVMDRFYGHHPLEGVITPSKGERDKNDLVKVNDVIKAVDRHIRDDGTLDEDISIILEECAFVRL